MIDLGLLGLGTAPIGGLYEAVEDETAHAVVERAWELGLRYFDTAPRYGAGLAEQRLGAVLSGRPRHEFAVSTKVGRLLRPGESVWRGAPALVDYFDFSHDAALRSLEESLRRLGLDRVDVAFVHDPDLHFDEALAGSSAPCGGCATRASSAQSASVPTRRRCSAALRGRPTPTASSSPGDTPFSTASRRTISCRFARRRGSQSS